jgi:hypothetical protein
LNQKHNIGFLKIHFEKVYRLRVDTKKDTKNLVSLSLYDAGVSKPNDRTPLPERHATLLLDDIEMEIWPEFMRNFTKNTISVLFKTAVASFRRVTQRRK